MCGPRLHPFMINTTSPGEGRIRARQPSPVRGQSRTTVLAEYKQRAQLKHLIIAQAGGTQEVDSVRGPEAQGQTGCQRLPDRPPLASDWNELPCGQMG